MYTKLFSHITESTVWHEKDPIRLVWITLLAMCDREGFVHSSVLGVASRARVSADETQEAIAKFLGPDPLSMSKDYEGRRIEEVEGGWRLLNYVKYRDIKTAEERREYMRNWMRKKREKVSKSVSSVDIPLTPVNNVSLSDTDTYSSTDKKSKALRTFVRPTLEEVDSYCQEKGSKIDPQKFWLYYETNGWMAGKVHMKNWKAAIGTWERNGYSNGGGNGSNLGNTLTKTEQRVAKSRAAIIDGLGVGAKSGPREPDLRDGASSGPSESMARLLLR